MTPKRTLPDIVVGNTTHRVAKPVHHQEGVCLSGGYDHHWVLTRDSRGHCQRCGKDKDFATAGETGLGAAIRAWQAPPPRKEGQSHEGGDS